MAQEVSARDQARRGEVLLNEILKTKIVNDGSHDYPLHSSIDKSEGAFIYALIERIRPRRSLEIGMAYGISTLFICNSISAHMDDYVHTAIDGFQTAEWKNIGRKNAERAGYGDKVRIIEELSELALPRLLQNGERFDFAFIDGWHTFDHALVDFFYINRMLEVGGICVLDDYHLPSIRKLGDYISRYPSYRKAGDTGAGATAARLLELGPIESVKKVARRISRFGLKAVTRGSTMAAFEKITDDTRAFDWYAPF